MNSLKPLAAVAVVCLSAFAVLAVTTWDDSDPVVVEIMVKQAKKLDGMELSLFGTNMWGDKTHFRFGDERGLYIDLYFPETHGDYRRLERAKLGQKIRFKYSEQDPDVRPSFVSAHLRVEL